MSNKKEEGRFSDILFRRMDESDLQEISRIENETFKDPWPLEALKYELAENPFCHSFSLEKEKKIIGYAFLHVYDDFSHLVNIALDKNFRGRGLGEYFLKQVIKISEMNNCERMVLEVREGNIPAVNLYLKVGFKVIRKQKKYYHDGEDALIMSLETGLK
ncbi:MAG: ribosomal protein S18-alanine N-acetyltransferase [Acidobacteria bacterium]|nr:ribosomal protein S18-alanine N-acetyltransferase [Acidobacteriota bacterium]